LVQPIGKTVEVLERIYFLTLYEITNKLKLINKVL
jgi:hypothetical protein